MQYGHFDNENREYVIDRVDLPVSWTNYIGQKEMYGVFNHTAGGYLLCGSSEYHRITRFRPNGVPMDGPGHYVYYTGPPVKTTSEKIIVNIGVLS